LSFTSWQSPSSNNLRTISWAEANRPQLTPQEKAGIPRGERNSPSPYQQIGTLTVSNKKFTVDSPIFGDYLNHGSQQQVFANRAEPNKVLKIYVD